ncbi:tRNA (adenosine(37)-N6)-threonylcarbamoyltransferase complex ATPase subunit type 1 TsaE [Alkalibaculum bacchi]|uniref:tRNA (adenosine(37)-N6)-threonylcarbamoyltransferase complex ATPase subunit type 1 TsaE n=1 Tax=Alkalibaculum bacchi TaxID=645887 RepID=UPI0026ED16F8|nr:tRNA (adenosine(37)-N6)-threonylcarbamoyltransferase complex ATPase subunit type 1 TsaE [Alkalibaculum bacchi]
MKINSKSSEETYEFGFALGKKLLPGSIVCIEGEMGAGKTALSQGIIRGLGVEDKYITSPTYTLVNEYHLDDYVVYHFDIYRVSDYDELSAMGFEEYIRDDSVVIIEWADIIVHELPHKKIWITLNKAEDFNKRILVLEGLEYYDIHL